METTRLSNNHMELTLDSKGRMSSLILLPDMRQMMGETCTASSWQIDGRLPDQVIPSIKKIDGARVRYTHVLDDGDLVIKTYYDLSAGRPEAICYVDIENHGDGVLKSLEFRLPGPKLNSGDPWNVLLPGSGFAPTRSWHFSTDELLGQTTERSIRYPVPGSMQWETIYSDSCSMYLAGYDKNAMVGDFGVRADSDRTELFVRKFVEIAPKESMSMTFAVGAVNGDWHGCADLYRHWAESWIEKPDLSDKARRIWMLNFLGVRECHAEEWRNYDELPAAFSYLKSKSKTDCVDIFGWSGYGHDTMYPEYVAEEWAGGESALRDAIKTIRDDGSLVLIYTNFRLSDTESPTYEDNPQWATGQIERYNASLHVLQQVMCPSCSEWQDLLVERVTAIARDLRPDGIQADQASAADPVLCRREGHGHAKSSMAFPGGYGKLIPRVLKSAREHVPDFFMFVEGVNDFYGQWFHFNQCAMSARDLRFYRYTLPWQEHIAGVWDKKATLRNLVVGLRGGDVELAESIKAARERFSEHLIYGTYRDNVGITHSSDIDFIGSYLSTDGRSVLVCAVLDRDSVCEIDLLSIGMRVSENCRVEVAALDGEVVSTQALSSSDMRISLPLLPPGITFALVTPA